jgi:signal peptidase II
MRLLLGGTLGNMVDRVFLGYVTDMLRIPAYPAIFNVADLGIRFGFLGLILHYGSGKVLPDFMNN